MKGNDCRAGKIFGVGDTRYLTTLTFPPAYPELYGLTSVVKWEYYKVDGEPTTNFRVLRSDANQTIFWSITVEFDESTNIDLYLDGVRIGNVNFMKPNHLHCVDRRSTSTLDMAPALPSSFFVFGATNYTLNCVANGTAIDSPVLVFITFDGSVYEQTPTSYASGLATFSFPTTWRNSFSGLYVRDATGLWYSTVLNQVGQNPATQNWIWNDKWLQSSGYIDDNIWPTRTFSACGFSGIAKGGDWIPPIWVQKKNSDLTFKATCTFFRVDHFVTRYDAGNSVASYPMLNSAYSGSLRAMLLTKLGQMQETSTDPLRLYFNRNDLAPIEDGLFTRSNNYPAVNGGPTGERWQPVPGSDCTGWTEPPEEPYLEYVVIRGTNP